MNEVRTILVAADHSERARHAAMRAGMLGSELNADMPELVVVAGKPDGFFAGIAARFRNEELIRNSERPVLLVNREPRRAYRNVVVGIDFSPESRHAARMALAVAPAAQFTFLHVFRVIDEGMMHEHGVSLDTIHAYRMRAREAARLKLNGFIEALGPHRQAISRALEHGMPGPVIHSHARQTHADLVVVGKHGKSRIVDFFLGSVTTHLIGHGRCDLLVTTVPCEDEPDP